MPISGSLGASRIGVWAGRSSFWNTGAVANTARVGAGGAGTQTAALLFGGYVGPGQYDYTNSTQTYNGSAWSVGGNMGTGSTGTGCGSQTAALVFGGNTDSQNVTPYLSRTEKYNGSAWSSTGTLGNRIQGHCGFGTQSAAVSAGGGSDDFTVNGYFNARTRTELFNGSTWSVTGSMNTARILLSACGLSTAGLVTGGWIRPDCGSPNNDCPYTVRSSTEYFNGSTWSNGAGMLTARSGHGCAGSQNLAVVYGGANYPNGLTLTYLSSVEEFNGVSWRTRQSMPGGINRMASLGIQRAAMSVTGNNTSGTRVATTYQYFS